MLDCSPIKRDRELGSDRRETGWFYPSPIYILFSSVAQYERNCHTLPMVKGLVDLPGSVATKGDFALTASKYKIHLNVNVAFRLAEML